LGAAQNRGALALTLMADQGRIDEATRDDALVALATLVPAPPPSRAGSYFADWVLSEAEGLAGDSSGAFTATATLDPALQAQAERILRDVLATEGASAGATQGAVIAMTPDGRVRAMVGGVDYEASQFNRATTALRQPGSTFKLFVYMAALLRGAEPDALIPDRPVDLDGWSPENFDGEIHGDVPMREAFAKSYNLATVNLALYVGIDQVIAVARQFGIEQELSATPSLALGTSEVTLLDMTEAYAAIALGRAPVRATGLSAIRFGEEGATLAVSGDGEVEQVELRRTLEPIRAMLREVVTDGTGRGATIDGFSAGKTGTSQNSRDAWFIGYTEDLVVGVWVGNDDNAPMDRVTGGGLPAEIWRRTVIAAGAQGGVEARSVAAAEAPAQEAALQCDIRACSGAYRSFRAEDCSFQPFSGERRLCTR